MTYEVYIDDERYSVLQLLFINAENEADAKRAGEKLLAENRHYQSVELRHGDAPLAVLQRPASCVANGAA